MKLTPLPLALALALTVGAVSAQTVTTTILSTTTKSSSLGTKTFSGMASWTYTDPFDLDLTLTGAGSADYSWTLSSVDGSDTDSYSVKSSPGFTSFTSWVGLSAGTYTFSYTGTLGKGSTASLSLVSSQAPVTPVPEPESYAMLLAGLGLMGAVARRRMG